MDFVCGHGLNSVDHVSSEIDFFLSTKIDFSELFYNQQKSYTSANALVMLVIISSQLHFLEKAWHDCLILKSCHHNIFNMIFIIVNISPYFSYFC